MTITEKMSEALKTLLHHSILFCCKI